GVERFLNQGGGVLVTLGERADAEFYNAELFRGGQGWMPAELVEPIGELAEVEKAARPQPESFAHPALELFREPLPGGLATAHFPRHWKLRVPEGSPGTAIGMFSDREPFLVERAFGKGSVIVAAVAMDNSWRTNLTTLPDFPRLAHELSYYLAGTRGSRVNLDPGQPIVFRPTGDEPPGPVRVEEPDGTVRQVAAEAWPAVVEQTRLTGVYKVTSDGGETRYYVVRPDAAESVLTPCTEEDREKVAGYFPDLRYVTDVDQVMQELNRADRDQEFWPLFMLLVIVLLCGEIWLTRRMAMRGQAAG
ncbi:MAG TPA: hypothetical protein VIL46_02855, partial [Gemmataceae bacterium]